MNIETIEYRGFNINIDHDTDSLNPRTDWDNLGTIVCWHPRYNLSDKQEPCYDHEQYWRNIAADHVPFDTDELSMETVWKIISKHYIVMPIYMYEHSGITIRTTPFYCPWDSGQIGWIYVSKIDARKEWSWKKLSPAREKQIRKYLKNEIEVFDMYLTGDVYGYNVEPKETNKAIECDDSCWGFFGYEYAIKEMTSQAKSAIDWAIKEYKKTTVKAVLLKRSKEKQVKNFMRTAWAY